jgi:hypothetical protein
VDGCCSARRCLHDLVRRRRGPRSSRSHHLIAADEEALRRLVVTALFAGGSELPVGVPVELRHVASRARTVEYSRNRRSLGRSHPHDDRCRRGSGELLSCRYRPRHSAAHAGCPGQKQSRSARKVAQVAPRSDSLGSSPSGMGRRTRVCRTSDGFGRQGGPQATWRGRVARRVRCNFLLGPAVSYWGRDAIRG